MLVVVGGHSRHIGKTAVVAGLIRKLRDQRWTALKITPYGHVVCGSQRHGCHCPGDAGVEHFFALREEYEPGETDSGRFLAAGAKRSFWLRTHLGELPRAAGVLEKLLAQGENVIVESNCIMELVHPDVFLMLLDFGCRDFKPSSLRFMERVDAFLVIDRGINLPLWEEISSGLWGDRKQFAIQPPHYVSSAVASFVRSRLGPDSPKNSTRLRPRSLAQ